MSPRKKITEENVKEGMEQGMTVKQIALKYNVIPYTVHLLEKKIKKSLGEENKSRGNYVRNPKDKKKIYLPAPSTFDLKVGDIVKAKEAEISEDIFKYVVVAIYEHVYMCKKLTGCGKWRTTFRKLDYKKHWDIHGVKLC